MSVQVSVYVGDHGVERMKTSEIAEWLQEVVPALIAGEPQDTKYLLKGVLSIMDSMTEMSEYISSDDKIEQEFLEFHGYVERDIH